MIPLSPLATPQHRFRSNSQSRFLTGLGCWTVRQVITIQSGLTSEKAKEISKDIRDAKLKVQAQIQGDQVRVQCKSKNELQATIAHLRTKDFGVDLQFCNYR